MPWTQALEMSLLSHLEGVWHQDKSLVNPEIIIKQRNSLFYILFLRVKHFPIFQHWLEPWILSKCSTCKDIWEPRDLVAFQKMIDFTWIFTNGKPQLPVAAKKQLSHQVDRMRKQFWKPSGISYYLEVCSALKVSEENAFFFSSSSSGTELPGIISCTCLEAALHVFRSFTSCMCFC